MNTPQPELRVVWNWDFEFRKKVGMWMHEAHVNGHVLIVVGPSINHLWTATVDGKWAGTATTEREAKELALRAIPIPTPIP